VLQDVAALAPPLIMCVAILLGVRWFLRREMAPQRGGGDEETRLDSEAGGSAANTALAQAEGASRPADHREDA
jgi:hypothetical protein